MKKIFSISLMLLFGLSLSAFARTTYNPDNTINVSSTIRGQKKLREQNLSEKRKYQPVAAAAAKIYETDFEDVDETTVVKKQVVEK